MTSTILQLDLNILTVSRTSAQFLWGPKYMVWQNRVLSGLEAFFFACDRGRRFIIRCGKGTRVTHGDIATPLLGSFLRCRAYIAQLPTPVYFHTMDNRPSIVCSMKNVYCVKYLTQHSSFVYVRPPPPPPPPISIPAHTHTKRATSFRTVSMPKQCEKMWAPCVEMSHPGPWGMPVSVVCICWRSDVFIFGLDGYLDLHDPTPVCQVLFVFIIQSRTPTDIAAYRNAYSTPLPFLPTASRAARLCTRSSFIECSVIRRVESENIPKFSAEDYERLRAGAAGARRKDMREDFSEPELSHPGEDIEGRVRAGMSSGMAKAATLRDVGKKVRAVGAK